MYEYEHILVHLLQHHKYSSHTLVYIEILYTDLNSIYGSENTLLQTYNSIFEDYILHAVSFCTYPQICMQ